MKVTEVMREDLSWWVANAHSQANHLIRPDIELEIFTDSSDFAWGATANGQTAGGPWSEDERQGHINVKELTAAFFGLKMFAVHLHSTHVHLQIDNTTAVAYINAQGGRKSDLNEIARNMWYWAIERDLWISAVHLPGVENVEADRASRTQYGAETEWSLQPKIFKKLEKMLGQFDLDLFATRLNAKCRRFFAWKPDPEAEAIDALAHSWKGIYAYAFPPFSLLTQVIQKISLDQADVTLVALCWATQPWFGPLLHLLISPPVRLPQGPHLLYLPQDSEAVHPLTSKLHLTVFKLSGNISKVQAFQQDLLMSSSVPGGSQPGNNISPTGSNGPTFVVNGCTIPFIRL